MNNVTAQGATYLVGFILPPFIDVVNKRVESAKMRFFISLIVSLIAAVAITYPSLSIGDVNGLLVALTIVFTEAQIVFSLYWKDSEARGRLQAKMAASDNTAPASGIVPPVEGSATPEAI